VPIKNTDMLLLLPNGTIYARIKLDSKGNFRYVPPKGSWMTSLRLPPASNRTRVLGQFFTDKKGNGRIDVPLPPAKPVVSGKIFFDNDLTKTWIPT
jgi:hypothetical protein